MSTADRHERLMDVFDRACEVPEHRRHAFLEEACAGDQQMLKHIIAMLAQDALAQNIVDRAASGGVMQALASDLAQTERDRQPLTDAAHTIGSYRIIRPIGEGGMGVVYLAEQENPRRNVAVKVIRSAFASPEMLKRFEHEAGLLGRLHHPGIAQVYEAGLADTDRGCIPFIAMELVNGLPITEYVKQRQLTTRQCLALIAKTADAVQHAHQRGVIHRDLKPANILVAEPDDSTLGGSSSAHGELQVGQPKILDFGVARTLDPDVHGATMHTAAGQLIGTLAYMSPEQVSGDPDEVDTRTDVYALGVILYQLLANRLPFDVAKLPLIEAVRMIREHPPRPLGAFSHEYRGDVQTIVHKALEKDRERRYASAADFAADIRRCLAHEPIIARPATAMYQLRKFAQRNKALVASAAVAFLTLLGALVFINAARLEANRQRDGAHQAMTAAELARAAENRERLDAQRQAQIAQAVNAFLNDDLLAKANPNEEPDRHITLRQVLDRAAEGIEGRFDDPVIEAAIRSTIAASYQGLGEYELAASHLRRTFQLHADSLGPNHPHTIATRTSLGEVLTWLGQMSEAEALLVGALGALRAASPANDAALLGAINKLAYLYQMQSRFSEAEELYVKAMAEQCERLGVEHLQTRTTMNGLAMLYETQGRLDLAEPLYLQNLQITRGISGDDHPDTLILKSNLAAMYLQQGRLDEADPLFTNVLDVRRRVLGDDHPETFVSMSNLVVLRMSQNRFEEAEQLMDQAIQISRRTLGENSLETLTAMNNLGTLYQRQGKFAEAEAVYQRNYQACLQTLGESHFQTMTAMVGLARCWAELGKRLDDAERFALAAHSWFSKNVGEASAPARKATDVVILVYEKSGNQTNADQWRREQGSGVRE